MTSRTWHKGPPPFPGWWNASIVRDGRAWRWWDGKEWSGVCDSADTPEYADETAKTPNQDEEPIEWTDYWPENARVPRVDPALQEARQKHDAEVQDSRRARIEFKALELVKFAADLGFNVTIERAPLQPLAMGHTMAEINVWPKRKSQ